MIGKKIANRYEVVELIGSGGMATVYKGKFDQLKRDVAIKVLHQNLRGDAEVVKSFNKEAQAAARLSDNNIVSVFDVGVDNGVNYMVMEYVDGVTLKQYIKDNGPLEWHDACNYMLQICHALTVAHGEHIVHRDIKPQNILITKDGVIKVTDFGIAKAAFSETITVGAGGAMGSVHYISPEQARGGYTDERSDIYSTGVLFYELVTGEVPYDAPSAVSVALMHIEKEVPVAKAVNTSIPIEISDIIKKAMSKEQFARYQTAEEFMTDIQAAIDGLPLPVLGEETGTSEDLEETKKIKLNRKHKLDDEYEDIDDEEEAEEGEIREKKNKKNKHPKTPEQKKADKLATVLAFVTVIVIAGFCAGGYFVYNMIAGNVVVPYLYEATIEEATQLLTEKGLMLGETEYASSDSVMKDRIISQNPDARTQVKKGTVINIVVSQGESGGTIDVPYVVNSEPTEAITKIIDAGLTYEIKEEYSQTVASGRIAKQLPEAGTKLNEGDVVTIYTSKGPQVQVVVPDFSQYTREKVESTLNSLGLKLGEISIKSSDKPEDTVIGQTPAAGSSVAEGSFVSIVLSSGLGGQSGVVSHPTQGAGSDNSLNAGMQASPSPTPHGTAIKKNISFTVPGTEGTAKVKVTANGVVVVDAQYNCGEDVTFEISSTEVVEVIVYINDAVASKQKFNE